MKFTYIVLGGNEALLRVYHGAIHDKNSVQGGKNGEVNFFVDHVEGCFGVAGVATKGGICHWVAVLHRAYLCGSGGGGVRFNGFGKVETDSTARPRGCWVKGVFA